MYKFQLPYSIVYQHDYRANVTANLDTDLNKLDKASSQTLVTRLEDPQLFSQVLKAQQVMKMSPSPDLKAAIYFLAQELIKNQSITSCFIWQQNLSVSICNQVTKRPLTTQEQSLNYKEEAILAHGLRWGWHLTESLGQAIVVAAETEQVITKDGCSCKLPECEHLLFSRQIRLRHKEFPECIKLRDATLRY